MLDLRSKTRGTSEVVRRILVFMFYIAILCYTMLYVLYHYIPYDIMVGSPMFLWSFGPPNADLRSPLQRIRTLRSRVRLEHKGF